MTIDISGKWALVAGASRGVGEQIALGLAQMGAKDENRQIVYVDGGILATIGKPANE